MAENWLDERDRAILETIYYCENCNMVLEPGDIDIERHKKERKHSNRQPCPVQPREKPVLVQELYRGNRRSELPRHLDASFILSLAE